MTVVRLGAAMLAAALFPFAGSGPLEQARLSLLGAALAAAALIDLAEHRIPNRLLLAAMPPCLALQLAERPPLGPFLPGLAAAMLALALALACPRLLGMGDAKLALLIAFALGPRAPAALAAGLLLAALTGLLIVLARRADGWHSSLPLAPFLAGGTVLALP